MYKLCYYWTKQRKSFCVRTYGHAHTHNLTWVHTLSHTHLLWNQKRCKELKICLRSSNTWFLALQEAAISGRVKVAAAAGGVAAAAGRSGKRRAKDPGSGGAAFAARRDTTGRTARRMHFKKIRLSSKNTGFDIMGIFWVLAVSAVMRVWFSSAKFKQKWNCSFVIVFYTVQCYARYLLWH